MRPGLSVVWQNTSVLRQYSPIFSMWPVTNQHFPFFSTWPLVSIINRFYPLFLWQWTYPPKYMTDQSPKFTSHQSPKSTSDQSPKFTSDQSQKSKSDQRPKSRSDQSSRQNTFLPVWFIVCYLVLVVNIADKLVQQCKSINWRGALNTTLWDKLCQ